MCLHPPAVLLDAGEKKSKHKHKKRHRSRDADGEGGRSKRSKRGSDDAAADDRKVSRSHRSSSRRNEAAEPDRCLKIAVLCQLSAAQHIIRILGQPSQGLQCIAAVLR